MPGPAGPYLSQAIFNALIPKEGPKAIPITFDFSAANAYGADFTIAQQTGVISVIQCLYVDNSNNPDELVISNQALGQAIKIPAYTQGYYPVLSPNSPKFTLASAGGVPVTVFFINVPLPAISWSTSGNFEFNASGDLLVSDPALEALIVGGALTVAPAPSTAVNASLVVSGVSQPMLPVNLARRGFLVIDYTNDCAINPTGAAALGASGSIQIPKGVPYISPPGGFAGNAIAFIGTAADTNTIYTW